VCTSEEKRYIELPTAFRVLTLNSMRKVAIIGTGIAGMGCAHKLRNQCELTLFEAAAEPGGHTHTRDLQSPHGTISVDTGFMVYNEVTYPLLTALFEELEVETVETDMSFGVQHRGTGWEFSGSSLAGLFAQSKNLFNPRFWGMLRDVMRFNSLSTRLAQGGSLEGLSLQDYIQANGFGKTFMENYLLPMTGAIWSTPADQMLEFPAQALLRFMFNHGLLGVSTHHQWRTVKNGSRQYRDKILAPFAGKVHCNCPIRSIRQRGNQVEVTNANGQSGLFDQVVIATHADTALKLLASPDPLAQRLLSAFSYSDNAITLHRDLSVMPRARRAWASWNYRMDVMDNGIHSSTHYWMNRLQHIPESFPVIVSLNDPGLIADDTVYARFSFAHPTFTEAAIDAQRELPDLNQDGPIFFCGSYFRYGFHEDALLSGYNAAQAVLKNSLKDAQLAV
jgi:predicted NAD/FAD-binding protein